MAAQPPEHTKWKPGVSGNPGGKSNKDAEIKAFKECTYKEFIDKLQHFGYLTQLEMKQIIQDPKTPMFDLVFSRILFDASRGKQYAVAVLLDRLWGKVKDTMELTATSGPQIMISLPSNGREQPTSIDVTPTKLGGKK